MREKYHFQEVKDERQVQDSFPLSYGGIHVCKVYSTCSYCYFDEDIELLKQKIICRFVCVCTVVIFNVPQK